MEPASSIIAKCGGHKAVAEMLGVHVSRVLRWTYDKTRGGSEGLIPSKHHATLLATARGQGIDLNPTDFFAAPANDVAVPAAVSQGGR